MEKRRERRVLALILAVLMVVSLIIPGSGYTPRNVANAAGEDDITSFLKGVDLYEAGSTTPKDVAWLIDSEKTYGMHVNFAESDAGNKQFHMDPDNRTFTYAFPAGVKITQVHSPLTILINDSQSIEGTTYAPTLVGDHYEITGTFADSDALRDSRNVKFYLDFDVQFEDNIVELDFGNNIKIPVEYDMESKVTVAKTGFYDTNDGKAHFTVTATSKRTNHNVEIKDTLTGTAYSGLTIDSITSGGTDISGSVTSNVNASGFDITIPTMTDGQTVQINYSVDIDYSKVSENGTSTETGNTVDVTSDEDPDPDPVPYNLQNKITYASLTKGASVSSLNADGSKTITYTARYNDYCIVPMNGVTLTDTITGGEIAYPADLKLKIGKYDKNNSLVSEETVSPATLNDSEWTYQLNDTTPYKYVITYEVKVPETELTAPKNISNKIDDGKGHTGTTGVTVGPEALSLNKSVADVDTVNKEVTWKLRVTVPSGGLGVDTVITDTVPSQWVGSSEAVENLVPGSLSLTSNSTGSDPIYTLAEAADQKTFTITFASGVQNSTGSDQTLEFEYKTVIDENWLAESARETWLQDHINKSVIRSGNQTGESSATAKVVPPSIKKDMTETAADGSGYPVYKFEVVVGNPTLPLVLEDTFDPELELLTSDTGYASAPHICSGDQYYQGGNDTAILPGNIETGEGYFRMTLDQSYISGSDSHYKITYALRVKSTGAYRRLAQRVADAGTDKIKLSNTAKVGDSSQKIEYDFEYSPVTKNLTNQEAFPESGEGVSLHSAVAQYQVVINPLGLTLNNGDPMTATDTFSNLAIDYTTISFDPRDAGITSDATGNVMTIRNIPDATPVTMTYSSRVAGEAGDDGKLTISNEFATGGHLAVSRKTFKVKADAGGTGSIRRINIFKYEEGDLQSRLKGAAFKMYDANMNPMKWKAGSSMGSPTEDVVITTNENGIAVLSQYDVDFMASDDTHKNVYYLKEIKAPAGYMLKSTLYKFMLIEGTNPDYTQFEYLDGDVMKIRNSKPGIYFTKVDENDQPLEGAVFTLYDADKNSLGITATSDADGAVSFKDIPVTAIGDTTFYVKETAVPDPQYALDETYYEIVFNRDANGSIVVKSSKIPERFVNSKDAGIILEKSLDTTAVAGEAVETTVKAQQFTIGFTLTAPAGDTIPDTVTAVVTKVDSSKENRSVSLTNGAGTITLADGESAKISNLPKGTTYNVTETVDSSLTEKGFTYDATATAAGYSGTLNIGTTKVTLTNGYDMPKTSLKVSKIWNDQNDKYQLRPTGIDVQLKSRVEGASAAVNVGDAVTLNLANEWTYTWNDLDKYDSDLKEITYSVEETAASISANSANYTAGAPVKVTDTTVDAAYTVTNTLKTGSILVKKDFVFSSDVQIPNSAKYDLTFQVKRGDTVYSEFTWMDMYVALSTGHTGLTISGLPLADDYKIIETNASGLLATYNLVLDETNSTISRNNIEVTNGGTAEVQLTNIYKKLTGGISLKAYKNVDGSAITAGSEYDSKFSFTLEETTAGNVADKLTASQTKTNAANAISFDMISYTEPAVHTYKISEGAVIGMPEIATDATEFVLTVTVAKDPADASKLTAAVTKVEKTTATGTEEIPYADGVGITFNNRKMTGDLEVSKILVSDLAADADQNFAFTVTLNDTSINGTYGDMTFTNGVAAFNLKGGENATATGLPEGVGYTVTEGALAGFTLTGKTGDTGTISEAAKAEAEFTNTRDTGDLEVTKTVSSSTASDKQKEFSFTVTLADTTINGTYGEMTFTAGVATFTLKDGESKTAAGLPVTVGYTVTETPEDGFITTKTGDTGSIGAATSTAAFTNTKDEGGLLVSKTVVSDIAADKQTDFEFTVSLNDQTVNGTYGDMTFTDGVATFTLKDGETKSATGLAKGIGYTVVETANNDFNVTKTGDTGTIGDTASTAAFTNTRKTGELEVSKALVSDLAADADQSFAFTVTLNDTSINGTYGDMTFTNGVAAFNLKGGESAVATGLPEGVGYTVTEASATGFTLTGKTGDTGTISETAKAEAQFTNTRDTGDLEVTKTVSSSTASDKQKEFSFTVTLADTTISGTYGEMTFKDGVANFTLKHGESKTAAGLPVTVEYTVTETAADGFITTKTGDTGSIGAATATAAFTNTKDEGGLLVSKTVVSDIAADKQTDFEFTVTLNDQTVNGTYGDMTFTDGVATFTLRDGETKSATGLAKGIGYTVVETANNDFNVTKTGDTGTIGDTGSVAAYTNTRKIGKIKINKEFVIPTDVTIPDTAKNDLTFQVKRGDTVYAAFTWQDLRDVLLAGGDGYVVDKLPLADDYKVVETNANGLLAAYNLVLDETGSTISRENIEVTDGGTAEVQLINTYKKLTGGISLKAYKNVDGSAVTAGSTYDSKFSFTLEETTAGNVADKLTASQTKTNAANAVSFDMISYTEPAVHTYKISEGAVVGMPDIAVDGTEFTLTVTVTKDTADASKLTATVTKVEKTTAAGTEEIAYADGVGITFNNLRDKKGDLEVSKTLVSDLAADADQQFNFTVTLNDTTISGTYGDMTFTSGVATFSLKGGESATATGLPEGVGYTVTEASATGFTLTGKTGDTGTISETAEAEAEFTNTRDTGDMEVTKTVSSSTASDKQKEFSFTVTLSDTTISGTYGDMTFTNGVANFTLKHGESKTAAGLPVTVEYTVTETAADGFITTKTGDTGSISATKATAAFTNTKDEGGLLVSKTVVSDIAADQQTDFEFTVTLDDLTVNGTYGDMTFTDGVAAFTLKDGETKSAIGLAKGIGFTVVETANNDFNVTKTGDTGTIGESLSTAAYTNTRKTGDLEVSKALVSDLAADADQQFNFTVTLDDTTISGTYGDMTFTSGVAAFSLKGGESATATGLPEGVGYTVTETATTGFTLTGKTGDTGTISEAAKAEAQFTNTRNTGDLEVTKTVSSSTASDKQKEFSFTVTLADTTISGTYGDMTFTEGVATFTLKDGESKTAAGLPVTVEYTVTETAETDFITTKTGDTGSISATKATAAFTNTKNVGTLKITKTIKGDVTPEEAAGLLQFTITDEAGDVLVINGKRMENLILADDFTKNGDIYELELTVPAGQKYVISEVIYDVDGAILESVTANGVALDKENGIYSMLTDEVALGEETVAAYEDNYKKGSLKITKTIKGDVTPEEAAGQLEFTITNETTGETEVVNLTDFDFDQTTGVYTYEIEAKPGDVYTVTETDYDVDGAILETVSHKIMAGPEEEGASATGIVISSTEQTRVDFEDDYKLDEGLLSFYKYGYVNELCSAMADEIQPLPDVVFQAEKVDDPSTVYYARSKADGLVQFLPMTSGRYKIWEAYCPVEYVLDDTIYYATIANGTCLGLETEDGTPVEKNRIINEPVRTDIEFVKVSEGDKTEKLEGSTYALFEESGEGSVTLIAKRTTDKDGKVKFEGVLPGKTYSIKEMTSPNGYYVSKNTVRIRFKAEADETGAHVAVLDAEALDDGKGTVLVDENGNITWLEPVVNAKISKLTKDGKLLAGATLRVEDEDGNVIIPEWVSGEEETEISGKLIVGHTYRLVEVKAPAGYALAKPVSFTVPDEEVGPGEEPVIKVSMIDEELPPSDVPKTSDDTPLLPVAGLMTLSLAGAAVVGTKKRKLKKDSKK